MQNIIFGLISFLIAEFALGYGAKKLFKKKKNDVSAVSRLCGRMLCDTAALLSVAVIYHSVYNTLVQSPHQLVGFLLPLITFVPVPVLLKKTEKRFPK